MYDSMSIVQLKQVAKTRHIKMYYTKKRHELIRLLDMSELPDSYKIEKFTIVQLRVQAKTRGMRGFWGLSREELITILYPNGSLCSNVDQKAQICEDSNNNEN